MAKDAGQSDGEVSGDAPVLTLEGFLPYRLNRLTDMVSRTFSRFYKERYGLTRPEWRALAALGEFGTMTATEIGANSAMHKTKVSRAVAALESKRWLTRTANPDDRRVERLTLTKAGKTAYEELVPLARRFEADLLAGIPAKDREALMGGLAALEKRLGS